jgi:hypothetical protein
VCKVNPAEFKWTYPAVIFGTVHYQYRDIKMNSVEQGGEGLPGSLLVAKANHFW